MAASALLTCPNWQSLNHSLRATIPGIRTAHSRTAHRVGAEDCFSAGNSTSHDAIHAHCCLQANLREDPSSQAVQAMLLELSNQVRAAGAVMVNL